MKDRLTTLPSPRAHKWSEQMRDLALKKGIWISINVMIISKQVGHIFLFSTSYMFLHPCLSILSHLMGVWMIRNTKLLLHLGLCRTPLRSGCLFSFSCCFRVFSWFWGEYESTQWRSWVKFRHLLQNTPCVLHVVSLPLSSRLNVSVESEGVSTDWTVMSESTMSKRVASFHSMFCSLFLTLSLAPAVFYRAASFARRGTGTPHREEANTQGRAVSADQSGEISSKWRGKKV